MPGEHRSGRESGRRGDRCIPELKYTRGQGAAVKRLVLRFDGGPLAGREFRFSPAAQRIVIGSAATADVRVPRAGRGIGSEHCELRRDAGRYELRVNKDDAVWLDGRRAHDGEELTHGSRLVLGSDPGHSATASYEDVRAAQAMLERARHHPAAWAVIATVILIASVALGWRGSAADPGSSTPDNAFVAEREPTPPSWSPVVARIQPSVYLVLLRSPAGQTAVGTAWVVAPGLLATNAHVALAIAAMLQGNPDHQVIVRAGVTPFAESPVIGVRIHPAFEPFAKAARDYAPMRVESDGEPRRLEVGLGYDVALLRVPASAPLGPPLPRAGATALATLRAGEPVAYVGFPLERLLEADLAEPSARSQTGTVVSITKFTMTHAASGVGQRIEHSLPATGGASGSPIFNGRGEVVALLSGGNVVPSGDGQRAPNAAMVNFAQRVDLLEPLLVAKPDEPPPVDVDSLRREWQQEFSRYDTPEQAADKHIAQIAARWARAAGYTRPPPPFRSSSLEGPWQRSPDGRVVLRTTLRLTAGRHMIAVVGTRMRQLRSSAFQGTIGGEPIAQDMSDDHYPLMRLQLERETQVELEIEDSRATDPASTEPLELRLLSL